MNPYKKNKIEKKLNSNHDEVIAAAKQFAAKSKIYSEYARQFAKPDYLPDSQQNKKQDIKETERE